MIVTLTYLETIQNYKDAIADFKKSPYYRGAGYGGPNWWEAPEYADKDVEKTAARKLRRP